MRTFFATSFLTLALLFGAAGAAPAAHAQTACPPGQTQDAFGDCKTADAVANETAAATAANTAAGLTATGGTATNAAITAANQVPTTPSAGSSATDGYNSVMQMIMGLFAWLVGVAAITLDYSVYFTVVKMGSYIHTLSAVGTTWRILRDLGNIMLIFGFLAIGISTILDTEKLGWGKKMLPMLLAAAVFLNFSLFFAEAVIDVGNLFATQFYTQINGGSLPTADFLNTVTVSNEGISNKLMSQLGLQTMYNVNDGTINKDIFQGGNQYLIGFMGIILFIVTAFVLFSLAFILIARFVALVFVIILAPVGFAGLAIPQLAARAKKWWSTLFEQTITAPVLLLLLYVALAVITDASFLSGFSAASGSVTSSGLTTSAWVGWIANTNLGSFASVVLSFAVAMGLLLLVVVQAKNLSAFGADWATKTAGKFSFGATAWSARALVGTGLGRGLLGNRFIKRGAVSDNKFVKYGSRALAFTGNRLQNRTYDVRNTGALDTLGKVGLSVNAGKASTLTARKAQEAQYGVKPVKEWFRGASKKYEEDAAALSRNEVLASGAAPALQTELKKMSDDEIAQLKGIRAGQDRLVQALSPTAYGNLMKNKSLLADERAAISRSWDSQFASHATSAATLGRMSDDERASLGAKVLAKPEVLENLSADDFDNIRGKLAKGADRDVISAYIRDIISGARGVPPTAPPTLRADLVAFAATPKFKSYYVIP
jgi:hypothetical protein